MKKHSICVDISCQINEISQHIPDDFEFHILDKSGPGGGWPFIEVRADSKEALKKWFCEDFCGSDIETEGEEFEEFYNALN